MDTREAMELLSRGVSGYFCDDFTDDGIEYMREHYHASKTEPHGAYWSSIKTAFETVLEHCTESELTELVQREFNRHVPSLSDGAKGFLAYIYKSVFDVE